MPSVTFDGSDWYTEVVIQLTDDSDFVPGTGTEFDRTFPLQPHTTNTLAGPIVVEGGVGDKDRALRTTIMLPYEIETPAQEVPVITDETLQTDTLLVFNDSSSSDDTGTLTDTNISGLAMGTDDVFSPTETTTQGLFAFVDTSSVGTAGTITSTGNWTDDGFAVGDVIFVEGGGSANGDQYYEITDITTVTTTDDTLTVNAVTGSLIATDSGVNVSATKMKLVPAGINYENLEIIEVMLGTGNDNFTVESTATDAITVIHGGGNSFLSDEITMGGDTITVNGGGGPSSPLIIYGDTSQDGSRFDSVPGLSTGRAIAFDNPGDDVINASTSSAGVTVFGGPGDDTIHGSQAGDHLAGGSGDDEIHGEADLDHIYGDGGVNADLSLRLSLQPRVITMITVPDPQNDGIVGRRSDARRRYTLRRRGRRHPVRRPRNHHACCRHQANSDDR